MSSPLGVFQVASGNVGTEMIKRIQNHPDLELVGLHCYSPDKIGHDVGDIGGVHDRQDLREAGVHASAVER